MAEQPTETRIENYSQALVALHPRGAAWRPRANSVLGKLLLAIGNEFARFGTRVDEFLAEADPRSAQELLPEWEAALGLPDPCIGQPASTQLRQLLVAARYQMRPGPVTPADFVAYALALGFEVEIEEQMPWSAGQGAAAGRPIYQTEGWYLWHVHAPEFTVFFAEASVSCADDYLGDWDNHILECGLERVKPAHTVVEFFFDLPVTGYQPWPPFLQLEPAVARAVPCSVAIE